VLVKSLKFLLEFGLFFGRLLSSSLGILAPILCELPLIHHLVIGLLVVLRLLLVVFVRVGSHRARVVLGSVFTLILIRGTTHHANVLSNVLFAHEITHVILVFIGKIIILSLFISDLLDVLELTTG